MIDAKDIDRELQSLVEDVEPGESKKPKPFKTKNDLAAASLSLMSGFDEILGQYKNTTVTRTIEEIREFVKNNIKETPDGKKYFIDPETGEEYELHNSENGRARVIIDGKEYFIDENGQLID